jgi:hypothetical protein
MRDGARQCCLVGKLTIQRGPSSSVHRRDEHLAGLYFLALQAAA